MRRPIRQVAALLAAAATALGGCAHDPTPPPGRTPPPTTPAVSGSAGLGSGKPVEPSGPVTWSTAPVSVVHRPAVPPVPVLTAVRHAGHPAEGYDRVVFDLSGSTLPGYTARYVSTVTADGSGKPITVPGKSFLLIVLNPAQAHTDAGKATVTGVHSIGLPMIKSYALAGDFEGHVSIALGLDARTGYRIGELPGRLYVDVAN